MKCKQSAGNCKLNIELRDNGDVFEFCSICDFSYLHKKETIQDYSLNPINNK